MKKEIMLVVGPMILLILAFGIAYIITYIGTSFQKTPQQKCKDSGGYVMIVVDEENCTQNLFCITLGSGAIQQKPLQ